MAADDQSLTQADADELLLMLTSVNAEEPAGEVPLHKEAHTVKRLDAITISVDGLTGQHSGRHIHIRANADQTASIDIDTLEIYGSSLDRDKEKKVIEWASTRQDKLCAAFDVAKAGKRPSKIAAGAFSSTPNRQQLAKVASHFFMTFDDSDLNIERLREFLHSTVAGGIEVDIFADEIFRKRKASGLDDYTFATKLIANIDAE